MQAFLDADVPGGGSNSRGLGGLGAGSSASDGVLATLRLDPAERGGGGGEGTVGAAAPASSWGLGAGGSAAVGVSKCGGSPPGVSAMGATAAAALDALLPFLSPTDAMALMSALEGEGEAARLSRIFRAALATGPATLPSSSGSSSGGSGGSAGVTGSIAPSPSASSPPTGRLNVAPGGGRSSAALGRNWARLPSLTSSAGMPNGTSVGGAAPKRRRPPQAPTHNSQEALALTAAAAPPPPSSSAATVSYSMPDAAGSAASRLWAAPGSSKWDGSRASWPTLSDSVSCAGDGGTHGIPPSYHTLSVPARSPVGTSPASSEETPEGMVTSSWAVSGAPAATSTSLWATEPAGRSARGVSWSYEEGGDTLSTPVGRSSTAAVLDKRGRAAGREGGGGRDDGALSLPGTSAASLPSSLSWAGRDAVSRVGPRTSWAMSSWGEEPSHETPAMSSSTMAAVATSASDFLSAVTAPGSASAAADMATSVSSPSLVANDDRPGPWKREVGGRVTTNGVVTSSFVDAGWQQPWRSFAGSSAGAEW